MFVFFKILNYETTRRDSRGSGVVGLGVNLYRSSADHSGKTVSYDVDKDGNMIKK